MSDAGRKWIFPTLIAVFVLGVGSIALWRRQQGEETVKPSRPSPPVPPPSKETRLGISSPPAEPPRTSEDLLIQRWIDAVRVKDRDGVVRSEMAFRQREKEFRDRLVRLARENSEPRVRAFTIAVLMRFQAPPAES